MANTRKERDPAEGARENVNVPIETGEAAPGDTAQHPPGGRTDRPDAETRDNQSQPPRDDGDKTRTTL